MISVVIPLYNKGGIIKKSLESVLTQNYDNFEVVVVNDGSTDNSVEIVKSFSDTRITLIEQENGGPSKARNTGVKIVEGNWILFLDADDELAEGALQHLSDYTRKYPHANIIDGSFIVRNIDKEKRVSYKDGKVIKNNYKSFFFRETLPSTGHTLFKRDLILKYPYNTAIRRYEDVEMIMRVLKDAKIVTTSKPIFYVNTHFSSASSARRSINEDLLGHLDFKEKSFWERMCLFQLYLAERNHYKEEVEALYPYLNKRYDLLFIYKTLLFMRKHHVL